MSTDERAIFQATRRPRRSLGAALVLGSCLGAAGCARSPAGAPPATPTAVVVSYPVERKVADYVELPARIAAVNSVEVRAHVWGYLETVNLTEGALVK
jgi:multidrug efflux pump subunit AcrA (membrane-fusion protein)